MVSSAISTAATPAAAPVASIDEVRNALTALKAAKGSDDPIFEVLKSAGNGATNLTSLKPEFYGAVVAAASQAVAQPVVTAVDSWDAPAAPTAKAATLEDVRAAAQRAHKRTGEAKLIEVMKKYGGIATDPSNGTMKPSFGALLAKDYAAVVAEFDALPATK